MQHLQLTLHIIEKNQLVIKIAKCLFAKKQVTYLGHFISNKGIWVDPEKIKAVENWPQPKNIRGLRGFLGLTGYYKRFIRHYGTIAKLLTIAKPLTDLLKKNAFEWNEQATEAFNKLKNYLMNPPVLSMPDFSKEFIIECDASGVGTRAVLTQTGRPIAYHGQALNGKNLMLSTYEKELLALILSTKKWSQYLIGRRFTITTDHQSLKHLLTQRLNMGIQGKWLAKLHEYDYKVE